MNPQTTTSKKSNLKERLEKSYPFIVGFISAVAGVAIAWYVGVYYKLLSESWYLPIVAGAAGLSAMLFPYFGKHYEPLWSLVSAGCTLFIIQSAELYYLDIKIQVIVWISTFFAISLITELSLYGLKKVINIGNLLMDFLVAIIISVLIAFFENPFLIITILIIAYAITISCSFSAFSRITNKDAN